MSLFSFFEFDEKTDSKIKIAANLSFLTGFGAAGWLASIMSFAGTELKLDAFNFGIILAANEIAVIFGFIISLILAYISESRMLGILVAFSGLAIILTAFSGSEIDFLSIFYEITGNHLAVSAFNAAVFGFFLSLTQNYFETSRDSLVKHSTDSSETALVLSKILAYTLLGTASGYFVVTVYGFLPFETNYYILFSIFGLPMIIMGILGSRKAKAVKSLRENTEIIFSSKFFNFYVLTFFTAAVEIIMVLFGLFFLAVKLNMGLGWAGLVFLLHSTLVFFLRHNVKKIIEAKGEDFAMKIRYGATVILFMVFITAAVSDIENINALRFVMILLLAAYGSLKLFDNSIKSYISYIATPNEQRCNMVLYSRLTQTAKIVIPVICAVLYLNYGFGSVFALGGISAAICFLTANRIYAAYNDSGETETSE
jgi:hypothetical protein